MSVFSQTYAEARMKFFNAAAASGVPAKDIQPYINAGAGLDPQGGNLRTDVVRLGPANAENLLIVSSGTHGVEGYAGSAIQTNMLSSGAFDALPANTAVVLVHAVNPYGFAHKRRVNENNVDLNRNFIDWSAPPPAEHPLTATVQPLFLPQSWQWPIPELVNFMQAHGVNTLKDAASQGQYRFADGLFYGGTGPEWSNDTWCDILERQAAQVKNIVHIDIHTGLGPHGHGELICAGAPDGRARAEAMWGKVTSTEDGTASSSPLTGVMNSAIERSVPGATVTTAALEFGTQPMMGVKEALVLDNWVHVKGQQNTPLHVMATQKMTEAFYPQGRDWQDMVLKRGREVIAQAQAGLARAGVPTPPKPPGARP